MIVIRASIVDVVSVSDCELGICRLTLKRSRERWHIAFRTSHSVRVQRIRGKQARAVPSSESHVWRPLWIVNVVDARIFFSQVPRIGVCADVWNLHSPDLTCLETLKAGGGRSRVSYQWFAQGSSHQACRSVPVAQPPKSTS
jgi:hypothetical protein